VRKGKSRIAAYLLVMGKCGKGGEKELALIILRSPGAKGIR